MSVSSFIVRAILIWILLATTEVLLGITRVRLLNRRFGDHRARQIGVGASCLLIFMITWTTLSWTGADTVAKLLTLGLAWSSLMLVFDLAVGRFVFHYRWKRIRADFDPRRGNLLAFGMLFLLVAPLLVAALQGIL